MLLPFSGEQRIRNHNAAWGCIFACAVTRWADLSSGEQKATFAHTRYWQLSEGKLRLFINYLNESEEYQPANHE